MKHTNEKFSIGGPKRNQEESISQEDHNKPQQSAQAAAMTEEEELQRALAQIREMEDKEMLAKQDSETQKGDVAEYLKQGEFVYELYSIMIHSGGAYGGHYYAYIKSFEDGKWYNFNDANVTEIVSEETLTQTFGNGRGTYGTAYLLMYRKLTG